MLQASRIGPYYELRAERLRGPGYLLGLWQRPAQCMHAVDAGLRELRCVRLYAGARHCSGSATKSGPYPLERASFHTASASTRSRKSDMPLRFQGGMTMRQLLRLLSRRRCWKLTASWEAP
jgi:hypothetical protein